jgi:RNAse (barnase) inhibitor barstar
MIANTQEIGLPNIMHVTKVSIDCSEIRDWDSFHDVFAQAFGFPDFYGRNMDAWIDCMTSLDAPDDRLSEVHSLPGAVLTLELKNVSGFKIRCLDQYLALIECSAFVNYRRIDVGEPAVIALSFNA